MSNVPSSDSLTRSTRYNALIDSLIELDATREGMNICDEALKMYPKNK